MDMSDTSETDEAQFGTGSVSVDFARRLERERDEAKDDLEFRRELYRVQENYLELARRVRDEARHEIEGWRNKWECAVEMAARAEFERDEWRNKFELSVDAVVISARAARAEMERDELIERNAKLRDIAERAIELALAYYDGPCERDGAKLRLELDQLKEGGK